MLLELTKIARNIILLAYCQLWTNVNLLLIVVSTNLTKYKMVSTIKKNITSFKQPTSKIYSNSRTNPTQKLLLSSWMLSEIEDFLDRYAKLFLNQ